MAHVQLSGLSLLLIRTTEIACHDTWRNLSAELDRIQLHTYDTGPGTVSLRTRLTAEQSSIREALNLPEPPRYYEVAPSTTNPGYFGPLSVPSCSSHARRDLSMTENPTRQRLHRRRRPNCRPACLCNLAVRPR